MTTLTMQDEKRLEVIQRVFREELLFQIPKNLAIVPTPIRELTCMCFWTAWWSFSINKKKSPPLTLKRKRLAYIERTRNGSPLWTYFLFTPMMTSNSLPDIFTRNEDGLMSMV